MKHHTSSMATGHLSRGLGLGGALGPQDRRKIGLAGAGTRWKHVGAIHGNYPLVIVYTDIYVYACMHVYIYR